MAPILSIVPRTSSSAHPTTLLHSLSRRASTSISRLLNRQSNNAAIIPTTYGSINSGPSPGTVVGIVLGSVGGFLLLLWLLYTCLNFGTVGSTYSESIVIRDRRKSRGSARSRRVSETVEVRRDRTPVRIVREPSIVRPPPVERVERVIVEERRETRREREMSPDSDEVVVIEEHSPPRRKKSERREDDRRESGYRTVDPGAYGGVVGGRKSSRR